MKYLFGPVNSRRLGLSLGVDLVPHKTCSLNCIYCECGPTTDLTCDIREYVPTDEVLRELENYFDESKAVGRKLDAVTFSGSGEPTLHSGIGTVIGHIKKIYPHCEVVVLTNGTLLWKEDVRQSLLAADQVVPSLDAVSEELFKKILRPSAEITAKKVINGIAQFRKEYSGKLSIEIFIIPGLNNTDHELGLIKEALDLIQPDEVHLNSLDRPPAVEGVEGASKDILLRVKEYLYPHKIEIIGKAAAFEEAASVSISSEKIMAVLNRRPSTVDDLVATLGVKRGDIISFLESMQKQGLVTCEKRERGEFYRAHR